MNSHFKKHFKRFKDKEIRQQLLNNLKNYPISEYQFHDPESVRDALFHGFKWSVTPQGFRYWCDIHSELRRNPDKYLKKSTTDVIESNYSI